MAITKETEIGEVRLTGGTGLFSIRTDVVIKEDGKVLSTDYNRHTVAPFSVARSTDGTHTFVETDISGEDAVVQSIINVVWTDEVKNAFKASVTELE